MQHKNMKMHAVAQQNKKINVHVNNNNNNNNNNNDNNNNNNNNKWEEKSMHGQYPKRVNEKDVDHQMSNQWRRALSLLPKTRPLRPINIAATS